MLLLTENCSISLPIEYPVTREESSGEVLINSRNFAIIAVTLPETVAVETLNHATEAIESLHMHRYKSLAPRQFFTAVTSRLNISGIS